MAYDIVLADRLRNYLSDSLQLPVEEKKMFGGLAFMLHGKMCINVSKNRLMCRYDPALQSEIEQRPGYEKMVMKGRDFRGYCFVHPEGYDLQSDFEFWVQLCVDFNKHAKSSKKK